MSVAQWRLLNSLLVMQKIVQVATTVISSAYPGKCHWLNMAPVHAVCRTHASNLDIWRGFKPSVLSKSVFVLVPEIPTA
jgi:hypothetical protein